MISELSGSGEIAALIPAYLEARHIRRVVERTCLQLPLVLVVDDGSTDATATEAATGGAEVVRHEQNRGKGAALKTGLSLLRERGYQYVVLLDGDGQHLPEEIPRFLESAKSSGATLLIGSRMAEAKKMPLVRRCVNRFMSHQISAVCGQDIPDTQCGFRMIHRDLIPHVLAKANAYEYETEMLFLASLQGCRIASVPISTIYADETSKIRPLQDTLAYLRLLWRYKKQQR